MTTPSLPISLLVNVSVNLTPAAAQAQNLNDLLILGSSDVIDVNQRIRNYATLTSVAADFGTTAPEYLAAVLWFEQAPQPTELSIGRWAKTATSGILLGGGVSAANQLIAPWNAVTTPGFTIFINGVPYAIAPASFAGATNLNGIATLIQTALAAAVAGTTCVWNSNYQRFQIEVAGSTGVGSTIGFGIASSAVGFAEFTGQPSNNDTLTLNGTAITFKSVATPGDVTIGASVAATLANLLAFCQASVDAQLVKFTYSVDPTNTYLNLVAATPGTGGNALTLAKSSANITLSGADMAGATAEDISVMMAIQATSSGAYVANGIAAESALSAVTLFDLDFGQQWYAVTVLGSADSDSLAIAPFIEGTNNKHYFGVTTQEAGVLSSVSQTDIAYLLQQLGLKKGCLQYSSTNPYAVVSYLARILTTDYNGNNTVITLAYKQEPGIIAENLNTTQLAALTAKGANAFLNFNNNTAIIWNGQSYCGNNIYTDEVIGIDWLAVDLMTAIYNLLYTSLTKIPQTDAGMHQIVTTAEAIFQQGVINGLLAPGTWNAGGFGTLVQGGYLQKGYYIYAPPVATQNQSNRVARQSVSFQAAAKLAGAVHTVLFNVNVNQ